MSRVTQRISGKAGIRAQGINCEFDRALHTAKHSSRVALSGCRAWSQRSWDEHNPCLVKVKYLHFGLCQLAPFTTAPPVLDLSFPCCWLPAHGHHLSLRPSRNKEGSGIWLLPCTRCWDWPFTPFISFNHHSLSVRLVLLSLFNGWGNKGPQLFNSLLLSASRASNLFTKLCWFHSWSERQRL